MSKKTSFRTNPFDFFYDKKIRVILDFLVEEPDEPFTLVELKKRTGLSEIKLLHALRVLISKNIVRPVRLCTDRRNIYIFDSKYNSLNRAIATCHKQLTILLGVEYSQ